MKKLLFVLLAPLLLGLSNNLSNQNVARIASLSGGSAGGSTVISSFDTGGAISDSIGGEVGLVFTTPSSGAITVSKLRAYRHFATGTRVCKLYNMAGTVLASGTVDLSSVSEGAWAEISVAPVTLSTSTAYAVFRVEAGLSIGQYIYNQTSVSANAGFTSVGAGYFSGVVPVPNASGKVYGPVDIGF